MPPSWWSSGWSEAGRATWTAGRRGWTPPAPRHHVGTTDGGQVLFGELVSGACTVSFSFTASGDVAFGCSGTVADSHREMFGSCSQGSPADGASGKGWACDVSPPIEPLVEFLPSGPPA